MKDRGSFWHQTQIFWRISLFFLASLTFFGCAHRRAKLVGVLPLNALGDIGALNRLALLNGDIHSALGDLANVQNLQNLLGGGLNPFGFGPGAAGFGGGGFPGGAGSGFGGDYNPFTAGANPGFGGQSYGQLPPAGSPVGGAQPPGTLPPSGGPRRVAPPETKTPGNSEIAELVPIPVDPTKN